MLVLLPGWQFGSRVAAADIQPGQKVTEQQVILQGHLHERLLLYATNLIIFIVRGETFISDMHNLASDLLNTPESQGLISVGFLIRIEMQSCYQAAGEALQPQRQKQVCSAADSALE